MIKIHLSDPYFEDPDTFVDRLKTINLDPIRPDENIGRYSVTIDGFQALNRLVHVCKESRRESLTHYRVHFPCRLVKLGKHDDYRAVLLNAVAADKLDSVAPKGSFYMNPEWDYVEVKCWPRTSALLLPFLNDLRKRYDPAMVGLLNLIVPSEDFFTTDLQGLRSMNLTQDMRESTAAALRSLQNVFFKRNTKVGRLNLGIVWGDISSGMTRKYGCRKSTISGGWIGLCGHHAQTNVSSRMKSM
ncbi:uncharacterized protein N0V89_005456 [Didymosphaeria variabile]|uniref:Uncharacterized protein n=1 Tax=Didymosphaeria variabile TaxID=1932322 RepID=A0A9W8XLD0_9PLEO|nr:uncharacterized protein N0V89_005456 [Didymosphaeria variabile]KAJ4353726.1 hypothetical protein N0V89_005456 [Didymosphaeria variabile]